VTPDGFPSDEDREGFAIICGTVDGKTRLIVHVGNDGAGRLSDGGTTGKVPELDIPGKGSSKSTQGDIGQVQGGTTKIADDILVKKWGQPVGHPVGQTTGNGKLTVAMNVFLEAGDGPAVTCCGLVDGSGKGHIRIGVIDDTELRVAIDHHAERDRVLRQPVSEIGRAVDGIDDPPGFLGISGILFEEPAVVTLFAYEAMLWVAPGDVFYDDGLTLAIGVGDELVGAFEFGTSLSELAASMVAGQVNGLLGEFEHVREGHVLLLLGDCGSNTREQRQ